MLTQFYVFEVKQYANGEYEHQVYWVWDEDADIARLKGESKYHEILASAAVSNTLSHSAILFSAESKPIYNQCYKHEVTVEPETETTE